MLCWSVPQIMSHLSCDRVEFSVCIWLENSFLHSREPQKWLRPQWLLWTNSNEWRWKSKSVLIVVYDSGVCFSAGNLLKCVESMRLVRPVSFQRTKPVAVSIVPPGVWKWRASRRVQCQWTYTMSTFFGYEKSILFFSKGLEAAFNTLKCFTK